MATYNLCILGFGNVGKALARLLLEKRAELRDSYGIDWRITGVATRRLGWLVNPEGLDIEALLAGQVPPATTAYDVGTWLDMAQAHVLFELTSTDPQTGQPAIEHIRAALERGAHAVTANKGAVVLGYTTLQELARAHGRRFLFGATVMAGAPVFTLFEQALPTLHIKCFRGLLNSTANVILAEMGRGKSFDEAVRTAQRMGIAETDPTLDVDGWDATLKVCAVANVLMHEPIQIDQVQREGIRHLAPAVVQAAAQAGTPFKLVASLERMGQGIVARVRPEQLTPGDPLAVPASSSSLTAYFETDVLPGLTITLHTLNDETSGPRVTAYDVMSDFVQAVR